jgi:hypothetical protein
VYNISRSWLEALILFGAISRWIGQSSSDMQPSCPLVTRAGFIVTALRRSNNPSNGKGQIRRDRKKARQEKSKVKSMLIIFFDIKGIVHKEFVLAGKRSIPHTAVSFYGDCVKM